MAGGTGYVAGGDRQFDVRIAEASACNKDGLGRFVFGALTPDVALQSQLHAAPRHRPRRPATASPPSTVPTSIFCGGVPRVLGRLHSSRSRASPTCRHQRAGSRPLPEASIRACCRRPLSRVSGPTRATSFFPTTPGAATHAQPAWIHRQPAVLELPVTGNGQAADTACFNAGSRDQNVYSAEYSPGNLFAGAPITFRQDNIPHAYPLFVENRAGVQRFFRLTIGSPQASFDYRNFDRTLSPPPPPDLQADIAIGPILERDRQRCRRRRRRPGRLS